MTFSAQSKVSTSTFQHVTVRDPLGLVQGLDFEFTFQHVTVRDPLSSVWGLNLTFTFQHVMVHVPLGSDQGPDLTFPFPLFQMVTSLLENNSDT